MDSSLFHFFFVILYFFMTNSLLLCDDERRNISCPQGWTIKIWFAAFKPAPNAFCSSAANVPRQKALCGAISVLWELARTCDGRSHCVINTTSLLREETCGGRRFLRTEYSCISSIAPYSSTQLQFFLIVVVAIVVLFAFSLAALLITVHCRRRRDSFPLTSLLAPLTDYENPEL